ncbi:hypothetical protein GUJ93_ZPchr0013g35037 [Zizania palustris]|uniref:BHLH domain-containing protein n=1 Tax=Zizania palustris TaxID=103762 RepID=A0A8J6BY81_ZIZPA|nr:hypothetical protein GUJ93_ZPchr0013g35037 [Zizania palustris]
MRSPVRVSTSWKPLGSLKLLSRLWLKAISGHKVQSLSLIDLDFLPCNWYSMGKARVAQHTQWSLPPILHWTRLLAPTLAKMSSRRSRSRQSGSSRITDEQISDLVSKLQDLLPEARLRSNDRMPSSRVLQETCDYIRSLHREVDDLSDRLSELLATSDMSSAQAAIIRSLLM